MGVPRKAIVEEPHVFVQHRMPAELVAKFIELSTRGKLAEYQQVGDLDKIAIRGQLFDRIATVAEDALFTVQEGNGTGRSTSVHVTLVERDVAGLRAKLGNVDRLFILRSHDDGQFELAVFER